VTKTTIAVCHSRTITSRAVEYCVEHSADAAPGTPHIRRIDRLPRRVLITLSTEHQMKECSHFRAGPAPGRQTFRYPIHQC
jgi:hypothetical protein